jgi:ABC-type multidrug transport system fused ATPase/permease subunit
MPGGEQFAACRGLRRQEWRERVAGGRRDLLTSKIGLLISHRLDGIRRADPIVVLRDGSIAEQGSHDALMRSDGEYARLFRTQAQGFLNPVT